MAANVLRLCDRLPVRLPCALAGYFAKHVLYEVPTYLSQNLKRSDKQKNKKKKTMENLTKEQEDFNRVMDDYGKAMKEYHEGIERNNAPILKAIKEEKGDEWFEELENLMEESEVGGAFKIVSKPSGDKQSSGKLIKWEWVDQCSVGDSGDSWEGTITVKISNGKYLVMPFSM